MLDVKQAVQKAFAFAHQVYDETDLEHLRLEEVIPGDDGRSWRITLGWVEPAVTGMGGLFVNSQVQRLPRGYKEFPVDGDTGEVKSMLIRKVA